MRDYWNHMRKYNILMHVFSLYGSGIVSFPRSSIHPSIGLVGREFARPYPQATSYSLRVSIFGRYLATATVRMRCEWFRRRWCWGYDEPTKYSTIQTDGEGNNGRRKDLSNPIVRKAVETKEWWVQGRRHQPQMGQYSLVYRTHWQRAGWLCLLDARFKIPKVHSVHTDTGW